MCFNKLVKTKSGKRAVKSVDGETDEVSDSDHFNFLELPVLVIDKILDNLDSNSLLAVRATCSLMKCLIDENSTHLRRLKVCISDENRLGEVIIDSNIPWRTAVIPGFLCSNSEISRFLQHFQYCLREIRIMTECDPKEYICDFTIDMEDLLNILCHVSPNLESLKVCCGLAGGSPECLEKLKADLMDGGRVMTTLQKNLVRLRILHFSNTFDRVSADLMHLFLSKILQICPNLVSLKLPTRYSSDQPGQGQTHLTGQPLMSYLNKIAISENPKLKVLDFGHPVSKCREFHLGGDLVALTNVFPLSSSEFLELIEISEKTGIKLYNVPSYIIPPLNFDLSNYHIVCLKKCVASVLFVNHINQNIEKLHEYLRPSVRVKLAITRFRNQDDHNFELPESLNLSSLCIGGWKYLATSHIIFCNLFGRLHSTVTKLLLKGECFNPPLDIKLSTIFPNLRNLFLSDIYETEKKRFRMENFIVGIQSLKYLTLKDCELLTYETHCEIDELDYIKAMKLTRLRVIRCNFTQRDHPWMLQRRSDDI